MEYLGVFMKHFLNNFSVFNDQNTHLQELRLCFDKCRKFSITINLGKCMFWCIPESFWDTLCHGIASYYEPYQHSHVQ